MANCSIPNSSPVSGRILTRSSRRLRKQNSEATSFLIARSRANLIRSWESSFFNSQRSTFNAQRSIQTVESWTLSVGRWAFSAIWRVKGAWWPSRSSKPSSPCKWRGRFDSYPLRLSVLDLRFAIFDFPLGLDWSQLQIANRKLQITKGGEPHVA